MLLTIDVGNSNIKFGVYENDILKFISRVATDKSKLEDEYAIEIKAILSLYQVKPEQIDSAVIGSVVPAVTQSLRRAARKLFAVEALVVKHDSNPRLELAVRSPGEVGADWIMAATAAKERYGAPCIIADMGTATKLIVLDKGGRMVGGSIIPGLGISINALFSEAALLAAVNLETPERVIGDNTVSCIQSGAIYGSAAMLDSLFDRMEEELGYSCPVVATGGLAETVVKSCRREVVYDETLLLDGLRRIFVNS